jgi:hypothetical protein
LHVAGHVLERDNRLRVHLRRRMDFANSGIVSVAVSPRS